MMGVEGTVRVAAVNKGSLNAPIREGLWIHDSRGLGLYRTWLLFDTRHSSCTSEPNFILVAVQLQRSTSLLVSFLLDNADNQCVDVSMTCNLSPDSDSTPQHQAVSANCSDQVFPPSPPATPWPHHVAKPFLDVFGTCIVKCHGTIQNHIWWWLIFSRSILGHDYAL